VRKMNYQKVPEQYHGDIKRVYRAARIPIIMGTLGSIVTLFSETVIVHDYVVHDFAHYDSPSRSVGLATLCGIMSIVSLLVGRKRRQEARKLERILSNEETATQFWKAVDREKELEKSN